MVCAVFKGCTIGLDLCGQLGAAIGTADALVDSAAKGAAVEAATGAADGTPASAFFLVGC